MARIEIITARTEERPQYFEFTKNYFMGEWPGMVKLDHDPFPDKKPNEVVRTEIISRKLVLHAILKGDVIGVRPGVALPYEGRNFAVISSEIQIGTQDDNSLAEVEAEFYLSPPEPMKVLAQLRRAFSKQT
jgi:hypothetical protein